MFIAADGSSTAVGSVPTNRPSLICVECGEVADGRAAGWKAYLVDLDDDGNDEPVLYCPVCAEREFADS